MTDSENREGLESAKKRPDEAARPADAGADQANLDTSFAMSFKSTFWDLKKYPADKIIAASAGQSAGTTGGGSSGDNRPDQSGEKRPPAAGNKVPNVKADEI